MDIPAIERAKEFIQSGNIDFLVSPHLLQAEMLLVQITIISFLAYISVKVSKL